MKFLRHSLALATLALVVVPLSAPFAAAATPSPQCIVSLSPTATETLFAIGAGSQVRAVDTDANFPLTGLPKIRINAFSPNVESIIGLCPVTAQHPSSKPDLVVISYDANDIAQKLTNLGIRVLTQDAPSTVAGAYAQITQLGAATGHRTTASALVATMKRHIAASLASVGAPSHLRVYYELDPGYYSLASNTFVGSLLKQLGLVNIADPKSTSADAGYPQLNAEYIVKANPQLIFAADTLCCRVTAATIGARPGFSLVAAVKNHQVVGLNDNIASRWGPRLVQLVATLATAVRAAEHASK